METRTAKVNISSAGGTAARGGRTCKVTLPTSWLDALGVSETRRDVALSFDGTKITLAPRQSGGAFGAGKLALGHDVRLLRFYDGNALCTTIYADFTDRTLVAENHTSDPVKTAFGNNALPTWDDFQIFLEERCVPRQRSGLREYLTSIGAEEYDPLEIIGKTAGRMAEDDQWLTVEAMK